MRHLLRFSLGNHLGLHSVAVLEICLVGVSVLCVHHPFSALLLVLLLGTFFSDHFQIFDQDLHFLFSGLLIALDTVDHHVNSFLRLLVFAGFCFFHVFFNSLSSFDSQIVFNHFNVFIDLSDFLMSIYKSQ